MKLNNKIKIIALSTITSIVLTACGSGTTGGSSTNTSAIQTGTFVDAPVYGLEYKTSTQSGYTNNTGEFKYVSGESIEFSLGNLSLGTASAGSLITPYTMAEDTNTSNPSTKAQNIAMLLQNFDLNRSNTTQLDLTKLKDFNFTNIDLSSPTNTIEIKLATMLATASFQFLIDQTNHTLIDATTAKNNMKTYIDNNSIKFDKKFTQNYLDGKTLYAIYDWKDNVNDPEKWTLVKEVFDGTNHTFNSWNGSSYGSDEIEQAILENGIIKVTPTDGNDIYTQKIISIDNDKITILTSGGFSNAEYFYFDEDKAKAKLEELQAEALSIDNIIGKSYYGVECSSLLGCEKSEQMYTVTNSGASWVDNGITHTCTNEDTNFTGVFKETCDDGDIEYFKITNITENTVNICWKDTAEEAKSCNIPNDTGVKPSYVNTYISSTESSMTNILTNKVLVTDFNEIKNTHLYQLNNSYEGVSDTFNKNALKIEDNGSISRYWVGLVDELGDAYSNDSYYNATFSNSTINVTGYSSSDNENIDYKKQVNKYNLANTNIKMTDFGDENIFDDNGLRSDTTNKIFNFTSGNMYCHILYWECWLDKDAMDQIEEQLK